MRVAASALIACSLAAVTAVGCGDIDASSEPFPGTILFQDAEGGFEFRLLQPPWLPPFVVTYMLPTSTLRMTFSIVPPVNATVTTDVSVLLKEALYSLQFSKVTGDPAAAMAEVKGSLPGGTTIDPMNDVLTASGTSGVEMAWQEGEALFHRDAFLAGTATPTFRLHFSAQKPIDDDPMVAQMINSFRAK